MSEGDPIKLDIPPGIWRRGSSLSAQGRYYDCDQIRFKNGLPEKKAGWVKRVAERIVGYGRGAMAWVTRRGVRTAHTGTYLKCYAATDELRDITPFRESGTLGTDPFSVTNGDATVTVTDNTHGLEVGARVHFSGADPSALIDRTLGSNIGDAIGGGGLAAIFDGTTSQTVAASGNKGAATFAYAGKTLGTAAPIYKAIVYGSNNNGYVSGVNPTITIDLYGKAGAAPANSTDGTLLGTISFTDTADESGNPRTVIQGDGAPAGDTVTIFNHVWVRVSQDGAAGTMSIAEVQLFAYFLVDGEYEVATVPTVNSYTVESTTIPKTTDATVGGAAVAYDYEVNPGLASAVLGVGFGVGGFGEGTFGTARDIDDGIEVAMRHWFFNRYGDEVLVSYTGGSIFLWDEPSDDERAVAISGAPTYTRASFVTAEGYIFALGTNDGDMVIRWPARDDPTDWNPDLADDANARRLRSGNRMMAGCVFAESVNCMWSDTSFFLANYIGQPLIYDTPVVGISCGLISQGSFAVTDKGVLWMGASDFYIFGGGVVDRIPNRLDMRDFVFRRLNKTHAGKVACDYDDENNSVIWLVPFDLDQEPRHYVEVSLDDWSWWYGSWNGGNRTAIAQLPASGGALIMVGNPTALGEGYFFTHNVGLDADGIPLPWFLEQSILAMADGDRDIVFTHYQPDYERHEAGVVVTITTYDRPRGQANNNALMTASYTIGPTTELVDIDVSGRYFVRRIESDEIASDWRGGVDQLWIAGAGQAA